jgi:coenzyme F420-reducing hydrogenase delta subunit
MVAREDGKPFPSQAQVNPDLCVGCGVCVGACDSHAINLPWFRSRNAGRDIETWIDAQLHKGQKPYLAFICRESASGSGQYRPESKTPALPGYRVRTVPCVGWISSALIERALQRGAAGVLIVGCGEGDPVCREGGKWLQLRLEGKREPRLDLKKADPARIRFVQLNRTARAELIEEAAGLRSPIDNGHATAGAGWIRQSAFAVTLACVLGGLTLALSNLPYRTPYSPAPELVVSFNHRGEAIRERVLTRDELDKLPPHMRSPVSISREKSPVRLRVMLGEDVVWDRVYRPGGISKDGPSVGAVRLPVSAGTHWVTIQMADTADSEIWTQRWAQEVRFEENRIRVLLFDIRSGFTLH